MEERKMLFRVGLMVALTMTIVMIFIFAFGNFSKFIYGEYTVNTHFKQASGVSQYTPVRKNGIRIGYVSNVEMDENDTGVVVTMKIQNKWKLFDNEYCLPQSNIMGDAVVSILRDPGKRGQSTQIAHDGTLPGGSSKDALQMVQDVQGQFTTTIESVRDTSDSFRGTSDDLRVTLQKLSAMLDENRRGIKTAIDQANNILADTRDIVGDDNTKRNLRAALEELPQMVKDTHTTVLKMQDSMKLVDENLRNVRGFTKLLDDRGEVLIGNLEKGTKNLGSLMSDMAAFSQKLNSSDGTVGLLMNDPQLYQHLARAAKNIDEITRELKPIKDDLRVFTDKIARHPESLGAKGIFEKKAGIK
jgi:phospholipid/cholesterol/gamma-HCH transport system substrate-binding protein